MSDKKKRGIDIFRFFRRTDNPLTAESVRFAYKESEVLRNVSLNLKQGSITAIIGKSGCGKSTFLKLVAGIIGKKYHGNIKIFGREKIFEKREIGFVPQETALLPDLSIEDNIKISGFNLGLTEKEALEKGIKLMHMLKLDEDIKKKPTELSGGQKVRVNIILSILHDPKILILDEPFVGLDFRNRRLLWHFIKSMKKKGKSVILTSHLLTETQEHVDRLVILKNGRVFFNGKMESLKNKLKVKFILEMRFSYLSSENYEKLKKYCDYREINILDKYEKYIMFGIKSEKTRDALINLSDKLNLMYDVVGFREPNLDEVFLNT